MKDNGVAKSHKTPAYQRPQSRDKASGTMSHAIGVVLYDPDHRRDALSFALAALPAEDAVAIARGIADPDVRRAFMKSLLPTALPAHYPNGMRLCRAKYLETSGALHACTRPTGHGGIHLARQRGNEILAIWLDRECALREPRLTDLSDVMRLARSQRVPTSVVREFADARGLTPRTRGWRLEGLADDVEAYAQRNHTGPSRRATFVRPRRIARIDPTTSRFRVLTLWSPTSTADVVVSVGFPQNRAPAAMIEVDRII